MAPLVSRERSEYHLIEDDAEFLEVVADVGEQLAAARTFSTRA